MLSADSTEVDEVHRARWVAALVAAIVPLVFLALVASGCGHRAADRNRAAEQAIEALRIGINCWTVDNSDTPPEASLVVEATTVPHASGYLPETVGAEMADSAPSRHWPDNPFTGKPMRQGTSPGDFTYVELADTGYRLTVFGADSRPLLVEGTGWDEALPLEMQEIDWLVRDWTTHHRGVVPAQGFVRQAGLGASYAGKRMMSWPGYPYAWPVNPYDGRPIHPGSSPGDYRYRRVEARRYELTFCDRKGTASRVTQ